MGNNRIDIQLKSLADGKYQIIIPIHLTPKSGRDEMIPYETGMDAVRIRIRAVPEDGKANEALLRFLAKQLGIVKSSLELVAGHQSRHKRVGITVEDQQSAQVILHLLAVAMGIPDADVGLVFQS